MGGGKDSDKAGSNPSAAEVPERLGNGGACRDMRGTALGSALLSDPLGDLSGRHTTLEGAPLTELEELIAKTDAVIAETAALIRDGRRRMRQDEQWLQNLGVDLQALKDQVDAEAAAARNLPVEALMTLDSQACGAGRETPPRRMKLRQRV